MAIIKRTPRPGELVRGATAGDLAAFGPDGELVDSGLATEDIPEWPEGGNEGDVLTKGADGSVWSPAPKIYSHSVQISRSAATEFTVVGTITEAYRMFFNIITSSSTPFTTASLIDYIRTHYDATDPILGTTRISDAKYPSGQSTGPMYRLKLTPSLEVHISSGNITAINSERIAIDEDGKVADTLPVANLVFDPSSTVIDKVVEI